MTRKYKTRDFQVLQGAYIFSLLIMFFILLSANASAYVKVYSDSRVISSCNFELSSYSVFFDNQNSYPVAINIEKEGDASKFLTLSKNNFLLAPNQSEEVVVFVNPQFKTGSYYSNLLFNINSEYTNKRMELSQKFIFTYCRTIELAQPEDISVCYNNRTNMTFQVKNFLNISVPIEIIVGNKKFSSELRPNENASFYTSKVHSKIGNMTESVVVKDLLTGYNDEKSFNIYVNTCGYITKGKRIANFFVKIINFFKRFWRYILTGIILLIILILIILSFRRYKRTNRLYKKYKKQEATPEIEVVSGEGKSKKARAVEKPKKAKKSEKIKSEKVKAYYKSVVGKESKWTKFNASLRENRKAIIITGIIILLIILFLIFKFSFQGYYYTYFLFKFKSSVHNLGLHTSGNFTNTTIAVNTTAALKNHINITNLTNASITPSSVVSEGARQRLGLIMNSIKTFFILYLNYIIIGILVLIVLMITLNVIFKNKETFNIVKKKRRVKGSTTRVKRVRKSKRGSVKSTGTRSKRNNRKKSKIRE